MKMKTEGTWQRASPRKTLWACVKGIMESFGCPMRMLRIGISGGQWGKVYLENGH